MRDHFAFVIYLAESVLYTGNVSNRALPREKQRREQKTIKGTYPFLHGILSEDFDDENMRGI